MRVPPFTSDLVLFVTSITNSAGTDSFGGCSRKLRIPIIDHPDRFEIYRQTDLRKRFNEGKKGETIGA